MDLGNVPMDDDFMAASELYERPVREGENWGLAPGDRIQIRPTDRDRAHTLAGIDAPYYSRQALDNDGRVGWVKRSSLGCTSWGSTSCLDACGLITVATDQDDKELRFRVDQVVHVD